MLSLKHGVTAHRRLLAVVWYNRRCKTFLYKIIRMAFYGIQAFFVDIIYILIGQMKFSSESRFLKP